VKCRGVDDFTEMSAAASLAVWRSINGSEMAQKYRRYQTMLKHITRQPYLSRICRQSSICFFRLRNAFNVMKAAGYAVFLEEIGGVIGNMA